MNSKQIVLVLVVIGLFLGAGCVRTYPGEGIVVSYYGSFNSSDSGFVMDGQLRSGGGVSERSTYQDVTICLYTEDGDLIHAERLGEWDLKPRNISIMTTCVPEFIVIDSPDFWDSENTIEYYTRRNNTTFYSHDTLTRKELPHSGCKASYENAVLEE